MTVHVSVCMQNTKLYLASFTRWGGSEALNYSTRHGSKLAEFRFVTSSEEFQLFPIASFFQILSLVWEKSIFSKKLQAFVSNDLPVLLNLHEIIFVSCLNFCPKRRRLQMIDVVERSLVFGQEKSLYCAFLVNLNMRKFVKIGQATNKTNLPFELHHFSQVFEAHRLDWNKIFRPECQARLYRCLLEYKAPHSRSPDPSFWEQIHSEREQIRYTAIEWEFHAVEVLQLKD